MEEALNGMKSLCKDIISSYLERKNALRIIKGQTDGLRKDFGKKRKEIRADLTNSRRIWNNMCETLRNKKAKR